MHGPAVSDEPGARPPGGGRDPIRGSLAVHRKGAGHVTHEVLNPSTALAGHNVHGTARALRVALAFHAPLADEAERSELGAHLGDAAMQGHARRANVHKPHPHTHDRIGHRIDTVEFHPSYHARFGAAVGAGLQCRATLERTDGKQAPCQN